jgi:hypothetical protein
MKKRARNLLLALGIVGSFAFGYGLNAARAGSASNLPDCEGEACKPKGAKCTNSSQCCSKNCQSVNGKETCH